MRIQVNRGAKKSMSFFRTLPWFRIAPLYQGALKCRIKYKTQTYDWYGCIFLDSKQCSFSWYEEIWMFLSALLSYFWLASTSWYFHIANFSNQATLLCCLKQDLCLCCSALTVHSPLLPTFRDIRTALFWLFCWRNGSGITRSSHDNLWFSIFFLPLDRMP